MTTDRSSAAGRPKAGVKAKGDEVPNSVTAAKPVANTPAETPPGCRQCFPHGWPASSFAVACDHGSWERGSRPDVS